MADISEECIERLRRIDIELMILERVLHSDVPRSLINGIPEETVRILQRNIVSGLAEEIANTPDTNCREILRELEPLMDTIKGVIEARAATAVVLSCIMDVRAKVNEAMPERAGL